MNCRWTQLGIALTSACFGPLSTAQLVPGAAQSPADWTTRFRGARLAFDDANRFVCAGAPMSTGDSPVEAAQAWLAVFRDFSGHPDLQLREQWRAPLFSIPRTVFAYQQTIDGVPVDRAI